MAEEREQFRRRVEELVARFEGMETDPVVESKGLLLSAATINQVLNSIAEYAVPSV